MRGGDVTLLSPCYSVPAACNAGEGNVRRFHGVPPFQETQNYIQRVNSFRNDLGSRLEGQVASLAPVP